jgi:hypothetical protein
MVRRLAVVSFLALAGCSGLKDSLSAHQDVVARAAGQELKVDRLAALVAGIKSVPLRRDVIDRVADLWVDYQLLGQATARGDSLMDTATVWAANWPQVSQRLVDHLHDLVIVSRARVTGGQVDSAYNGGGLRYIAHILVAVRQDTTVALKAEKRQLAEGYLAQLRHGADFARLAAQKSNDPGSAKNGGSLGIIARGQMVKPFEDAVWSLKPGEISPLVTTPYGYHIIWRPRLDQVRDSFTVHLQDVMVQRLDSLYIDSLNRLTAIDVKSSAPTTARAAANDLRAAKQSGRVLATYHGGELTERDFARWLQAFPPQTRAMIGQAPDSSLKEFVKSIARNDMLIHSAQERHIGLTAEDRDSITVLYRRELRSMVVNLGVSPDSLAADTAARSSRTVAAGRRVDRYFDDILKSTPNRPFVEIPPFLADVLRQRYAWDISPAGVDRTLEKAKDLRGPGAPPGAPNMSPMTPAPSGPPMSRSPLPGAQGTRVAPPKR